MNLACDPIARKELILDKIVIAGADCSSGDGIGSFAADSHMHSYTRAFGDPLRREGVWLRDHDVAAKFILDENFAAKSYELKLIAAIEHWRNRSAELAIFVNGREIHSGRMLFENVASGWPANLAAIPRAFLRHGENSLTLRNLSAGPAKEGIIVNRMEIIVRPADSDFQFELAPAVVRTGEPFSIRVLNRTGRKISVELGGDFRLLGRRREGDEEAFELSTSSVDNDQTVILRAGRRTLLYRPERIVHAESPYEMLVGTDFDDDRHDESTLRTLDFIHKTEMGNVVGFRPKPGRNCIEVPSRGKFIQWFDFLKSRRMNFWIENGGKNTPWLSPALARKYAPHLQASKYHEFCNKMADVAAGLRDLEHARQEFRKKIADFHSSMHLEGLPFWISSATMKIVPAAGSELVDLPIAEPTTFDHVLMYSGLRRTALLRCKPWGAHVPVQWYLGDRHDHAKLCRFRTSLYLAYIFGAKLIYSESGLFKTVQFSQRFDSDRPYTRALRDAMREFYAFTRVQPLRGKPKSAVNVLYGNLDSFFFYPDHIPLDTEPKERRRLWYRWERQEEDFGWLACRNLLQPLNQSGLKGYGGDESANSWFSSNPYGGVDVIPIEDIARNPLKVSFLFGRNVMSPTVHRRLCSYVRKGGWLFLAANHFNIEKDPARPKKYFRRGDFSELCGIKLAGGSRPIGRIEVVANDILALPAKTYRPGFTGGDDLRVLTVRQKGCIVLARDARTRAPVLVAKRIGKGCAICFVGLTTIGNRQLEVFVDDVVKALAQKARPDVYVVNEAPVNLQEYQYRENSLAVSQLFLVNFNWKEGRDVERAELAVGGNIYQVDVSRQVPRILYRARGLCFGAEDPLTQVWDIQPHGPAGLRFSAAGRGLEKFVVHGARPDSTQVTYDGKAVVVSGDPDNAGSLTFSCDLNRRREIVVM